MTYRRRAYAALVIDGKQSGPRQFCYLVFSDLKNGRVEWKSDRRINFTANKDGNGHIIFYTKRSGKKYLAEWPTSTVVAGGEIYWRPFV
jgi:hypothetical protein